MLQKLKNDNTGTIYISRVVCYFIIVCVLGFTLDVIVVLAQNVVTSYEAAYYAEKISIQGGLLGEERAYPSVNEVNNTAGDTCYDYKKPCTSCLLNEEVGSRMNRTFKYFNINQNEWQSELVVDNSATVIHSRVSGNGVQQRRVALGYMSTAVFKVSTDWEPMFAKWIWGQTKFAIDKEVPIIIEYIPQVDSNDPTCVSKWYGG